MLLKGVKLGCLLEIAQSRRKVPKSWPLISALLSTSNEIDLVLDIDSSMHVAVQGAIHEVYERVNLADLTARNFINPFETR